MEILSVLILTAAAVILFMTEAVRVDVVAIIILVTLALSGLVSPEQALAGFSNPATATVAAMFVLSAALKHTGVVEGVGNAIDRALGRWPPVVYGALLALSAAVSAFINNTAAVAVFIPLVLGLCRRLKIRPGRLLMPVSYAAQVGGTCTLIGTSTNILVSDIARRSGQRSFEMFEFSRLGVCMAGAALLYLALVAPLLLRRMGADSAGGLTERYRVHAYLAELEMPSDSPLAGKTLAETNLERDLDIQVLEVIRPTGVRWLPDPHEPLQASDQLLVRGRVEGLLKTRDIPGLKIKRDQMLGDSELEAGDLALVEALIPPESPLIGRTLEEYQFRRRHRLQALAIRHHDRLQQAKVGKVRLAVGDVLLLQGLRDSFRELREGSEVMLMDEVQPHPHWREGLFATAVVAAVVAAAALGVAPILATAVAGCVALVVAKVMTVEQAYEAIDWKVIFLLAGVIPLGTALQETGAVGLLATYLVKYLNPLGPWLVLSFFYLLTTLITEWMSNNASAALLAPLAIATADQLGVDARPFLIAVAFAASTSLLTPVGYQTNAMVMGPGGYRFFDYTRVGGPLNLMLWLLATWLIPLFFPF